MAESLIVLSWGHNCQLLLLRTQQLCKLLLEVLETGQSPGSFISHSSMAQWPCSDAFSSSGKSSLAVLVVGCRGQDCLWQRTQVGSGVSPMCGDLPIFVSASV